MKVTFVISVVMFFGGCIDNNPSGTAHHENKQPADVTINGEKIFKENCAACHTCYGDMTGPALHGSFERWGSKKDVIAFVQNSKPIIGKIKYATDLKKKYGLSYIHGFNNLDSNQIKALIYWCDNYSR